MKGFLWVLLAGLLVGMSGMAALAWGTDKAALSVVDLAAAGFQAAAMPADRQTVTAVPAAVSKPSVPIMDETVRMGINYSK